MSIEYLGLSEINGPLVVLEGIQGASYEEIVEFKMEDGVNKIGRIVEIYDGRAVIQVFEGTENMSLNNTHTRLTGHPMEINLSPEILGRTFNGIGHPIDGLGDLTPEISLNVNGYPLNPVSREYPRNYINTGISAIDSLTTLIRGQKLPIFSGNGLPHDKLAAQIVQQASLGADSDEKFAIVFAAMGVKYDVADFFRRTFEESGVSDHVVMFLNLANDPVVERLITPRLALTAAEYLAFEKDMHILVILTDITSFCEAMREVSSSKGEIPSRKGYPGYLYSELATLYERAGIVRGGKGSVTQIPILTMPNDDITHPIPDLTGYITEGQIVLDRQLHGQAIYPPINVLPSLSRLMKDGIGEGYTRKDHQDLANQLFSCYAKVGDARALASVIGEDELSSLDKKYLAFGKAFEYQFVGQGETENRTIIETLDKGWALLSMLPKEELDRIDTKLLDVYYKEVM
ncbi:MAG: V-type ATP synthase subunit B [Lachnospiraceae bacterium]